VYGIAKHNTGSGRTEVHVLNGANNFQSFLLNTSTALGTTGTDNSWVFAVADYNRDGAQDLYAIGKHNTGSGRTEVHVLNGANNFQSFLLNTSTVLGTTGNNSSWVFAVADYNRDGAQDVYGIAKHNTGSGRTEVHVLNGANNFQSFLLNTSTALGTTGTDNSWVFTVNDYNHDGAQDVYGIAKHNTGSGRTEVHVLNGANNFQSFLLNTSTVLGTTGTDSSWVFAQ
jgi:serine protease